MPKRWLSRNGRHNDRLVISSPKGPVLHDNSAFDFAFTDLHSQQLPVANSLSALPSTATEDARPTTSAGVIQRARKPLRIDILNNRPRSSDGTLSPVIAARIAKRRSSTGHDFIGVAFGSPSHPPMAFCNDNIDYNPTHFEHAFGAEGPFPEQRLQPAKWKKLGNLFRTRPGVAKGRSGGLRDDLESSHGPGPRHHWYKQHSVTADQARVPATIRVEHPQKVHDGSDPKTVLDLQPSPPMPASTAMRKQASLPRLDTQPPNLRTLPHSNSSSSLLARRSRTLENLKPGTWLRVSTDEESEAGDLPRSARRQTTPTMSKPPSIAGLTGSTNSPAASKYSLFPPTSNIVTGHSPLRGRLERAHTSPARLSPAQKQFPGSTCPAQQRRGVTNTDAPASAAVSSPEEHTASTTQTDRGPWSTKHSKESSTSSANTAEMEEIFFDIKSYRDSNGLEKNDLFEMTRPDSVQVSLARTRSKLTAAGRPSHLQHSMTHKRGQSSVASIVRGKTPQEDNQMRIEAEKLREIELRVQQEVQEKREKLLNGVPQIPTPNVNEGRFSVSTAIFDETIAAVEAMSAPTGPRSGTEVKKGGGGSEAGAQPTQSGFPKRTTSHTEQPSLSTKLLPPDPGMPNMRPTPSSKDKTATKIVPAAESGRTSSLGDQLLADKPERNARAPSPLPTKAVAETTSRRQATAVQKAREEHSLDLKRKPLPASSDVLVEKFKTASPQIGSQLTPLSATSVYSQSSQPSPSSGSQVSKTSLLSRVRKHDRPIEESPTIPQSPGPGKHNPNRATLKEKPPPVPEKDAKFIPISKFAAKSTIAKVEQRAFVASDVAARRSDWATQGTPNADRPTRPVRTQTLPSPKSPMFEQFSYKPSPKIAEAQKAKKSPQLKEALTVVQAKPAAEVSVARTVSLARKQSKRVNVATPKLEARRQEEEAKSKEKEQQQQTEHRYAADHQAIAPPRAAPPPAGLGLVMGDAVMPPSVSFHTKNDSTSSFDRNLERSKGPLNSNPSTPEYVLENPVEKAERERAQKAAIVEAAKARARARRRAESETREQKAGSTEEAVKQYRDSQGDEEKARWDLVDNARARAMSPLMVEGHRGHKPGVSMNVVVESA
ncbi:uncharacterized protein AB675_3976 [Cyphellophora attinorum]|uniref:Uncharacterized protein n=1 Tax=Cyphellophora attinorum TaxID=1664694 RepID=A0A0N1NXL4_9EURO|nr:uncharacterized protein AB675_3976 [Phialophora attinorum]KPI37544.1 hypothetical protein AB675_3976 [Phialophora attinorum]